MRRNVFRSLALPLLAAVGLVVAGCTTPPPAFTFYTGKGSMQVPPTQYCNLTAQNCQANGANATVVTVPDGQLVQVSAPESVATTPWQVAAEYKNPANNASYIGCSPLFPANQQYAYTVRPPSGDQLVLIEIYQTSASAVATPNGDFAFLIRGTWVLTNNANGTPTYPKAGDNLCGDQGS